MPFKYNNNYREESTKKLIKDIWLIDERDIELAFSDIDDEYDVDIKTKFLLKSPKNNYFKVEDYNLEIIEAYAASGFTPSVEVKIKTNDDIRTIQTLAVECVNNIMDYYIIDVKKKTSVSVDGAKFINLTLALEEIDVESPKSKYHTKSFDNFKVYLNNISKFGYKSFLIKNFEVREGNNDRFYIKYQEGTKNKKLYTIILEKEYEINIEMIDHLSKFKEEFLDIYDKIDNDFNDSSYDMIAKTAAHHLKSNKIKYSFSISFYED
jgi:hypothetical protein